MAPAVGNAGNAGILGGPLLAAGAADTVAAAAAEGIAAVCLLTLLGVAVLLAAAWSLGEAAEAQRLKAAGIGSMLSGGGVASTCAQQHNQQGVTSLVCCVRGQPINHLREHLQHTNTARPADSMQDAMASRMLDKHQCMLLLTVTAWLACMIPVTILQMLLVKHSGPPWGCWPLL
jgi:hypothetical protein